jgi:glucan phosphoethanolaminetransferase (alkaline phosphatase superfamily)
MTQLSDARYSKWLARVMSIVLLLSSYLTYTYFVKANTLGLEQSALNWSIASMLVVVFSSFILSAALGEVYWVYFFKKMKLDERQLDSRRRIYEKSYVAFAIIILLGLMFLPSSIGQFTAITETHHVETPILQIMFYIYSLPSVIAAWQKGSM